MHRPSCRAASLLHHRWRTDIFIIAVLFLRAVPGFVPARLSAIAPVVLAAALFAIPADEARAHNDYSATLHAETYPLHEAAKAGDLNSVNHFITVHMADVDAKGNYGNTPLHEAALRGNASVVSILIAAGAEVNAKSNYGNTPLHFAAYYGRASVVSVLIAAGAEVNAKRSGGDTPLHEAAWYGRASVVSVLIAAGANVNATGHGGDTPLHEAAAGYGDNASVASILIAAGAEVNAKRSNGDTPLHYAARYGNASVASILIAAGAEVNAKRSDGDTPLHYAARYGNASVASILIAAGAEVNAKNNYGSTPLDYAAVSYGHASVVSVLVAAGAEVNAKSNYGDTLLHYAAWYGRASVVSVLIAAGAHVNAINDGGSTPLHRAAYQGYASVVSVLIAAGADVNAKNNDGETPLYGAAPRHASIVPILIAAGGHWGEACAGAATVNPAGASIPCLCESPNVGTVDNCAESCGELTPPMHYDATAGECVPLAACRYEEVRNEETNTCECHAPNVRADYGRCRAPSSLSADICARTSPPQFYSPTLSACTSYDECMASEDCALNATSCARGFSPDRFYDSEAGECVPFAECDDTAELNQNTNQCECTESSSQRYLRPSGVCESRCNNAEIAVRKGQHRYGYSTSSHYECECAATKNGIETATVNGVCEFLYPCHESAIRKVDNSGCECPAGTYAHGDPSGGSHSHIPDTAICHANHAPIVHNPGGLLDSIRADNPTLILHFVSQHDESPNQLVYAINNSASRAVKVLIERGANVDQQDSRGETPLHLAARRSDSAENAALVSFLLDKGADPNIFNNNRWRPLDLADGRDGYPRRRKIMSALIAGGANWSDECIGGKVPNEFTPPKCKCPARLSIDNNGLCECPGHSHSQVNGLCLPKDSAQVEGEIAKMRVELARLRAALVSLNARLSLSAEAPREMVEDIAEQARETAAEIDWRRANFVALGRRAEAGEAPPPVALSDTAAECRMRGGEVRIDSGSGTRICLGLDRSGTFCLVDSGDAFPCLGLFKHVRRCNDVYHRPALNAFICGERCGADETARGRGCE